MMESPRNQYLVILKGETLWDAWQRHFRDYGAGPVILAHDYNRNYIPMGRGAHTTPRERS